MSLSLTDRTCLKEMGGDLDSSAIEDGWTLTSDTMLWKMNLVSCIRNGEGVTDINIVR